MYRRGYGDIMKYCEVSYERVYNLGNYESETWDDVEDWYIKWDALHVKFKGQSEWREYELDSDRAIVGAMSQLDAS